MRNFRELKIWQKGMDIAVELYSFAALLPAEEKYGLRSQLQRAAISIPSNIAEGCSRESETDFKKFLEYSLGSAFEIETQLIAIDRLHLVEYHAIKSLMNSINEEQKMINGFIESIKKRNPKKRK
jgi:four helix bundle protein